jgi:hypothetical protein
MYSSLGTTACRWPELKAPWLSEGNIELDTTCLAAAMCAMLGRLIRLCVCAVGSDILLSTRPTGSDVAAAAAVCMRDGRARPCRAVRDDDGCDSSTGKCCSEHTLY